MEAQGRINGINEINLQVPDNFRSLERIFKNSKLVIPTPQHFLGKFKS